MKSQYGSPMDGIPPWTEDLIEIVRSKTICAVTIRRPLKQRRERKWQSTGGLSERPWVRLPTAPPFLLSVYRFKGFRTVTVQIVFDLMISIRSSDHRGVLSIRLPMLLLTILHD